MLHTACVAVLRRHPQPCRTSAILSYGVRSRKHQVVVSAQRRKSSSKASGISFQKAPSNAALWSRIPRASCVAQTHGPCPTLEPCGKASFGCALQQQLCRHGTHGPNSSHVARPHSTVPNSSSDVDITAMPINTDMVVTRSLGSNLRAVGMSSFRLM